MEPELDASSKVYPTENPEATVEPAVGVTDEKTGVFASIPGAAPHAISVISVPMFPAASFRVMLTGSASESRMLLLPSTTV